MPKNSADKKGVNWKIILAGIVVGAGLLVALVLAWSPWVTKDFAWRRVETYPICGMLTVVPEYSAPESYQKILFGMRLVKVGAEPCGTYDFFVSAFGTVHKLKSYPVSLNQKDKPASEKIVYSFGYEPVNPEYIRITTIIVERGKVTKTVEDGDGDIRSKNYFSISSSQFNGILEGVKNYGIAEKEMDLNSGCTGGSTRTLQIFRAGEKILDGEVYSCGGKNFTSVAGDFEKFFAEIESLVP